MNSTVDFSHLRSDSLPSYLNPQNHSIVLSHTTQDVYLYCASKGLGTVSLGMYEEKAVRKVFKLEDKMNVILAQAVGFPK